MIFSRSGSLFPWLLGRNFRMDWRFPPLGGGWLETGESKGRFFLRKASAGPPEGIRWEAILLQVFGGAPKTTRGSAYSPVRRVTGFEEEPCPGFQGFRPAGMRLRCLCQWLHTGCHMLRPACNLFRTGSKGAFQCVREASSPVRGAPPQLREASFQVSDSPFPQSHAPPCMQSLSATLPDGIAGLADRFVLRGRFLILSAGSFAAGVRFSVPAVTSFNLQAIFPAASATGHMTAREKSIIPTLGMKDHPQGQNSRAGLLCPCPQSTGGRGTGVLSVRIQPSASHGSLAAIAAVMTVSNLRKPTAGRPPDVRLLRRGERRRSNPDAARGVPVVLDLRPLPVSGFTRGIPGAHSSSTRPCRASLPMLTSVIIQGVLTPGDGP